MSEEQTLPDRIAQAVVDRFDKLPGRGKPQGRAWTVLAGVVLENEGQPVDSSLRLQVLTLATGTRCIGVSAMVSGSGKIVHDCHAEVLCRRILHRYLFNDVERASSSGSSASIAADCPAVLERVPGQANRWRMRSGLRLHFYVSTLPCGECTLVPIHSTCEGTLKRKTCRPDEDPDTSPMPLRDRNRTGAKPSIGMPLDPKAEGIDFHCSGILRYKSGRSDTRPESRSVSYSCSEKICRWNHVGWQGASLSRLIETPLTMTTIIVGGQLFDKSFVENALFKRATSPGTTPAATCPRFLHTRVQFEHSREIVENPDAELPGSKVSTAGLCIVWGAHSEGARGVSDGIGGARTRPISSRVGGFYDVLIGHTGERQGLRGDRQKRQSRDDPSNVASESAAATSVDSWVSPLCKRLTAEDAVHSLVRALGSEAGVASWLLKGPCLVDSSESTVAGQPLCNPGDGSELEPLPKCRRLEDGAVRTTAGVCYMWLKAALTSQEYYDRRLVFHGSEPFVHWRRKRKLAFSAASNWEPVEADLSEKPVVDSFYVDLPGSLTSLLSPG